MTTSQRQEKINWTTTVQVLNGPKLAFGDTLQIDAYDKVEVDVPPGPAGVTVLVHPGAPEDLRAVCIQASKYRPGLAYHVGGATIDEGKSYPLDNAQAFLGKAASFLGACNRFKIVHPASADAGPAPAAGLAAPAAPAADAVKVTILVGRVMPGAAADGGSAPAPSGGGSAPAPSDGGGAAPTGGGGDADPVGGDD